MKTLPSLFSLSPRLLLNFTFFILSLVLFDTCFPPLSLSFFSLFFSLSFCQPSFLLFVLRVCHVNFKCYRNGFFSFYLFFMLWFHFVTFATWWIVSSTFRWTFILLCYSTCFHVLLFFFNEKLEKYDRIYNLMKGSKQKEWSCSLMVEFKNIWLVI
jgi:hypothetical protein